MKKIEAVIRKSKFREVKKSLLNAGIDNFSYWLIRNVGEATESRVYRGVEYETSAVERIYLFFLIDDEQLSLMQLLVESGLTGEAGDGRIIITEVKEAFKLVTQDDKDIAINLKK